MKLRTKIMSLLMTLVMLFSVCGSMWVFADADSDELNDLLASLDESSGSDADISGSDISGSDVKPNDHLMDYKLLEFKAAQYGMSVLHPDYDKFFSVNSNGSDLTSLYGDSRLSSLFDLSGYYASTNVSYLCAGFSDADSSVMSVTYSQSDYTRFVGDLSKLSAERQKDIADNAFIIDDSKGSELRIVNGNVCLYQETYDEENDTAAIALQTIVKGAQYELYILMTEPNEQDYAIADRIVNSFKVSGYDYSLSGSANLSAVVWLAVISGLLLVVVCLLAFFIIRFSLFAKAAGSAFNIIGFNLPPNGKNEEQ